MKINVWLSTRARPTVRMKIDGFDFTLERMADPLPHSFPEWDIVSIGLPDGGGLMGMHDRFHANNIPIIQAAEEAYQKTKEGQK